MVIRYLDLISIAVAPNEANPELIVDANRMLARPIADQCVQFVIRQ